MSHLLFDQKISELTRYPQYVFFYVWAFRLVGFSGHRFYVDDRDHLQAAACVRCGIPIRERAAILVRAWPAIQKISSLREVFDSSCMNMSICTAMRPD